ncbi:ABC transporter ATP-binding protein [Paradesulfitobacterium aromaticivorans]
MILETKALGKDFGGLTALNDVDFQINEGEIVSIIGPNGAGKSTFFNVISGFYPPSRGSVKFQGREMTGTPTHIFARWGIARTFQSTHLFTNGKVLDNLIIGYRHKTKMGFWDAIIRTPRARREEGEARKRAERTLEFVGLAGIADEPVTSISQEEGKRLAIGLALMGEPRLLLLDEPAAGINHNETNGLVELIKKIRSDGITVCLIEHKVQMVMGLADKIMVLNYGSKIAEGTPKEISSNHKVIEAYLGRAEHA